MEKKFRQINTLVNSLVKQLFSQDFCEKSVRENFCNFHTVKRDQDFYGKNQHFFRQNNLFTKKLILRKIIECDCVL